MSMLIGKVSDYVGSVNYDKVLNSKDINNE